MIYLPHRSGTNAFIARQDSPTCVAIDLFISYLPLLFLFFFPFPSCSCSFFSSPFLLPPFFLSLFFFSSARIPPFKYHIFRASTKSAGCLLISISGRWNLAIKVMYVHRITADRCERTAADTNRSRPRTNFPRVGFLTAIGCQTSSFGYSCTTRYYFNVTDVFITHRGYVRASFFFRLPADSNSFFEGTYHAYAFEPDGSTFTDRRAFAR